MVPPSDSSATEQRLRHAAATQPGGVAYDNQRPVVVPAAADGLPLLDMLRMRFPHLAAGDWEERCDAGRFLHPSGRTLRKTDRLQAGLRIIQLFPGCTEPPVATDIRVVFEDDALLVIDKPAPLPMHPSGRFNRNTLHHFLHLAFDGSPPLHAHRLDANTTGLVVLAKSKSDCHELQRQFRAGMVDKTYRVRTASRLAEETFVIDAPISRSPWRTGVHRVDLADGKPARTHFRVLRHDADGTSLLEARLETGRTNQIRVHLWQAGHPVCGDPSFLPGHRIGGTQTLPPDAPPLCLHACHLGLCHPRTGVRARFSSVRDPDWLQPR